MNCAWVMPNSFRHLSLNSHHYCSLMNEMLKQVQHDGMWLLTSTTTFKAVFPIWEFHLSLFKVKRLRVIAKKTLRDFWEKHPDSEQQLKAWYQEADNATWKNPNAIKKEYPSASIIGDNRVVFNIKGNDYRLIVKVNYDYQMIWVRFVGTHAQYDKINANKI